MKKLVSICLLLCSMYAFAGEGDWCESTNIPLNYPTRLRIRMDSVKFLSAPELSVGKLRLTNTARTAIQNFLIVVELYGPQNRFLMSVAFYNPQLNPRLSNDTPFDFEFKPWLYANGSVYQETIGPRKSVELQFSSPVVPFTCPVAAKATIVHLKYVDGFSFRYMLPAISLNPVLTQAPLIDKQTPGRFTSVTTSGLLAIEVNGHAAIRHFDGPPDLHSWFDKELGKWVFSPALSSGNPTPSDLAFVLTIGTDENGNHKKQLDKMRKQHPSVLVGSFRLIPPFSGPGSLEDWQLLSGLSPPSHGRVR